MKAAAQEALDQKRKGLDEAMGLIERGDLVALTILAPGVLSAALQKRAEQLGEVHIRFLAPRELNLLTGGSWTGEREIEIFIGDTARPSHDAHDSTYLPNTFMLGMKAFDNGRPEARMPDVLLTPCSERRRLRALWSAHVDAQVLFQAREEADRAHRPQHRAGPW